jgi:hypothetical protein
MAEQLRILLLSILDMSAFMVYSMHYIWQNSSQTAQGWQPARLQHVQP